MAQRSIGSLLVSEVGVGCNNFGKRLDQSATTAVVLGALDEGVNFFDTADIYGDLTSEVMLGVALQGRRSEAVIATKFGVRHDQSGMIATPAYVREACEGSLQRLGVDYIDLYQLHYPNDETPLAETLGAMQELVAEGKVREIGCSNFSAVQLREAHALAGTGPRFVTVQSQYSLLARYPEHDGVLAACAELNMGFLPYYPLANGLLTGKVRKGHPLPEGTRLAAMDENRARHWTSEEMMSRVDDLMTYAEAVDVALIDFAFSWLLSHPEVPSVIAGASSPDQVRANNRAVRALTAAQIARLNELTA